MLRRSSLVSMAYPPGLVTSPSTYTMGALATRTVSPGLDHHDVRQGLRSAFIGDVVLESPGSDLWRFTVILRSAVSLRPPAIARTFRMVCGVVMG